MAQTTVYSNGKATLTENGTGKVISTAPDTVNKPGNYPTGATLPTPTPEVAAINATRQANVDAGKDAYTGAPVTDAQGKPISMVNLDGTSVAQTNQQLTQSATPPATSQPGTQSPDGTSIPSTGNVAQDVATQQKAALANIKQSGAQSPDKGGEANAAIDQAIKDGPQIGYTPTPEVQTQVDDALSTYTKAVADYINPTNQRQSLVDEYKQMSDALGISGLKTELLDVNRIMNGTEDDIRSEVTAAGGFATESQVQAMTIGRNKSLLKKAQFVQDQLTAAKDELGTMMNLSAQDRQYSENRMQSGISLLGKVVEIQQSMKQAATDNYNNIVKNAGYDGLLKMTGGDPYNIAMTEKTLGLGSGGLSALAKQSAQERALAQQKDELQLDSLRSNLLTDKLQRSNISDEIRSRQANDNLAAQKANTNEFGTLNGKAQTVQQAQANGYADRMVQANKSLSALDTKFSSPAAIGGFLPNFLKSSDRQVYEQAQTNFVNAILRQESGAAISSGEFKSAKEQYFAQPGDSAQVLLQKQNNRNTAINNFYRQANVPRPVSSGDLVQGDDGKNYKVGDDGETLIPIN